MQRRIVADEKHHEWCVIITHDTFCNVGLLQMENITNGVWLLPTYTFCNQRPERGNISIAQGNTLGFYTSFTYTPCKGNSKIKLVREHILLIIFYVI